MIRAPRTPKHPELARTGDEALRAQEAIMDRIRGITREEVDPALLVKEIPLETPAGTEYRVVMTQTVPRGAQRIQMQRDQIVTVGRYWPSTLNEWICTSGLRLVRVGPNPIETEGQPPAETPPEAPAAPEPDPIPEAEEAVAEALPEPTADPAPVPAKRRQGRPRKEA